MTKLQFLKSTSALVSAALLIGCSGASDTDTPAMNNTGEVRAPGSVNPAIWPKSESPVALDPAMEARITDIISQMTLRQKIGQVTIILA